MVTLTPYTAADKDAIILQIVDFFGFHAALLAQEAAEISAACREAEDTLCAWTRSAHALYCICFSGQNVGFLHIGYRGQSVAWIEDIFVEPAFRKRGIATQAITLAQEQIAQNPAYTAICFDVAPRNTAALKLYHKLGYDSLSLVTVRKELYSNPRDKSEQILGLDFKL